MEDYKNFSISEIRQYKQEFLKHCQNFKESKTHDYFMDTDGWKYIIKCLESLENEEKGEVDYRILDKYDAFCTVFDKYEIFQQVVSLVNRLRVGQASEMVLFGLPLAIKDNVTLKDYHFTNGITEGPYCSSYDATSMKQLLKSGVVVVGKTKLNGFGVGANTTNVTSPIGEEYIVGGSSGGSGAAVGGNAVTCAVGTDTGGSVRSPAAFCGCIGYRPSHGAISRYGMSELTSEFDCQGFITKSIFQLAHLAYFVVGFDIKDMMTKYEANTLKKSILNSINKMDSNKRKQNQKPLENVKIGMFELEEIYELGFVDEENKKNMEHVEKVVRLLGAEVVKLDILPLKAYTACYYLYTAKNVSTNIRRYHKYPYAVDEHCTLLDYLKNLDKRITERFLLGEYVMTSAFWIEGLVDDLRAELVSWVERNKLFTEVEFLISPTTSAVLPNKTEEMKSKNMYMLDLFLTISPILGVCSLSLPLRNSKRPNSLQITGGYLQDHRLFEVSQVFEEYFNSKQFNK